jgi:hypothetical protein
VTFRLPDIIALPLISNAAFGVDLFIPTREPELYIEPVVNVVAPSNMAA